MKKFLILVITILLTSCSPHYFINGAGKREINRGSDSSWRNHYKISPSQEWQHINYGRPYKFYKLNGNTYYRESEYLWRAKREQRYDYLYKRAIENGYNVHWYIDRNIDEGESNGS